MRSHARELDAGKEGLLFSAESKKRRVPLSWWPRCAVHELRARSIAMCKAGHRASQPEERETHGSTLAEMVDLLERDETIAWLANT